MKIDYGKLTAELSNNRVFESLIAQNFREKFDAEKRRLLKAVEQHPISQELNAGPTTSNTSGTLNGVGNLFSFLGFPLGSRPVDDLLSVLEQFLDMNPIKKKVGIREIVYSYSVYVPVTEIQHYLPLPYESGRAWPIAIEEGISNFSNYIYLKLANRRSRSAYGLQNPNGPVRLGQFNETPYLSVLLNDFLTKVGEV